MLRQRAATDAIVAGQHTLSAVAHAAGYADEAHLNREFRNMCGVATMKSAGGHRAQAKWFAFLLRGVAEVFDATQNSMRIELSGSGYVVHFEFPERGPASAVRFDEMRMRRVQRTPTLSP